MRTLPHLLFLGFFFFSFATSLPRTRPPVLTETGPMAPPRVELKGTDESQRWQNYMADIENLSRIENHEQLLRFEEKGLLVSLPETATIVIDERLKESEEYCYVRPWTRNFLEDLGRDFHRRFPNAFFQINSATRDRARQTSLQKSNANAAAAYGPKASSHLTGATIDITKRKMEKPQVIWMRRRLFSLAKQRLIWVTEESRNQTVFHIMVFSSYRTIK